MTPSEPSAIVRKPRARILIRATNWVGDAVITMPAVHRLRELERDAHLTLLCPAKLHDLWRHNPHLNAVIDIDELHPHQYDVALILPNSFHAAWECRRARIPIRVGFTGHWRRQLLTHVVQEPKAEQPVQKQLTVAGQSFAVKSFPVIRHQVHRYLDLIAFLGGNRELVQPKIWLAPGELSPLTKFFREDSRPVFAINAGAEYGPAKRWFPERFAEVAERVAAEVACRWLLLGGPGDGEIAGKIEADLRARLGEDQAVINTAGKTTLLELCELIKFSQLLLTNDTGPMHIATAVGTPVVALFGSTSAELTGPLGPKATVITAPVECTPCFLRECPIDFRCMNSIIPAQVTDAVLQLWRRTEPSHGHL
jgi:heptosyltransferase II